jgi:hypothetical protein
MATTVSEKRTRECVSMLQFYLLLKAGHTAIFCVHLSSFICAAPSVRSLGTLDRMWTVEDHLHDKPEEVRRLYEAFERLVSDCGSFERSVTKTAIAFKGTVRGFAGITPRRSDLTGFLDLTEQLHEPPFTRVTPYTKRLWVHRFVLNDLGQLDARFASRVAQAYAVGQGAHR